LALLIESLPRLAASVCEVVARNAGSALSRKLVVCATQNTHFCTNRIQSYVISLSAVDAAAYSVKLYAVGVEDTPRDTALVS